MSLEVGWDQKHNFQQSNIDNHDNHVSDNHQASSHR